MFLSRCYLITKFKRSSSNNAPKCPKFVMPFLFMFCICDKNTDFIIDPIKPPVLVGLKQSCTVKDHIQSKCNWILFDNIFLNV